LLVQTVFASFGKLSKDPEGEHQQLPVAMASLEGISPRNEIEGMLAAQMIGVHNLSMEMMELAAKGEGHLTLRVNSAVKLSHLFLAQIEALNRYRGKGQQKVTVEHVTVHQGGQAIVGVIEPRGEGESNEKK
jgi:hypothetical protein